MSEPSYFLTLHETTARQNWPTGRMPGWVDETARLYTGFELTVAARTWKQIVAVCDGERTRAYVTQAGFDVAAHGPAIHQVKGSAYRRCIKEWFRAFCGTEVAFA